MLTIGHSNRPLDQFLAMLAAHTVELLVDVRTVPKSRHNPQFHIDNLPGSLQAAGVAYISMPSLGGLRRPRADSINTGWRNLSFRGYADYMQTPAFETALEDLQHIAVGRRATIMCAEAVPWRCHRSLIADALTVRGVPVQHIMSVTKADTHKITSFAKVDGIHVTYPAETLELF